jgi:group II intron reverse transcriptase/maturase
MTHEETVRTVTALRHNEYYGMQETFDKLYEQSLKGNNFNHLMEVILSDENILLAYRNIKANEGSKTPGTDSLTIKDIATLSPTELTERVRYIMVGSPNGYTPKPVRRKEIPKPNGKMRPLGIPCIWDRLIQQCIKQVLEPICEAKFSANSCGFRPLLSVETAIARTHQYINHCKLYHVIEFDIKGFFDNVNHQKLIKQIWAMGIHDKKLIWIIKRILKAPIKLENGIVEYPNKGTPQGGIISPLLANIVLNELDQWVESQWANNPITENYASRGHGYRAMRDSTNLKEMRLVRYADDFRIFCKTKQVAEKMKIATQKWLEERLKLEISPEKTRIVDLRDEYMEFLGFSIKARWNYQKKKYVVTSHISKKALKEKEEKLVEQTKKICSAIGNNDALSKEIMVYNAMVMGIQNYYRIATNVAKDLNHAQQRVYRILYNRTNKESGSLLSRKGRPLTDVERKRYGKSKAIRYIKGVNLPIYPISYVQNRTALLPKTGQCMYTLEGRKMVHDNITYYLPLLNQLRNTKPKWCNIEIYDNKLSLYSAQQGKCYIMGEYFEDVDDIHCHHKLMKSQGGTDAYENLVLIREPVHKLIHSKKPETILKYLAILRPNSSQLRKINYLRFRIGEKTIKKYDMGNNTVELESVGKFIDI